jgi:serine/threonine protein kinase
MPVPSYATGPVQPPGWVLGGRYTVLDRLGSGGMADVFRAHDEQLDRDVAIKVFRTPVDEPGNAHTPERRETELHALAQLSHPNLITLYDANVDGALPAYLVTELVIGPNLAARIAEGPVAEDLARTIGMQIADALAYVHSSGMVHRDVKPANILLGTDGPDPETATIRARLSDFGIVRVLDDARMTAAEFTLGTASYIAPEQARGADVGPPADVYALALVMLEMLTGKRSFDGPMHEAVAARLVRAPEIPPGLPQPWPGLLAAMTALDPARRPTAAEVANALRTSTMPVFAPAPVVGPVAPAGAAATDATVVTGPLVAAAPVAVSSAAPPVFPPSGPLVADPDAGPPPRRSRRTAALVAVAALALVAILATAGLLLFKPSSGTSGPASSRTTAPSSGADNAGARKSGSSGHRHGGSAPAAGPVAAVTDSSSDRSRGPSRSGAPSSADSSSKSSSAASSSAPGGGGRNHPRSSSSRPAPSSSKPRPSSSTSKSAPAGHTSSAPSSSPVTSTSPASSSAAAAPSGGAAGSAQPG